MKYLLLTLIFLTTICKAQEISHYESILSKPLNTINHILNQEFSRISNVNSNGSIGNNVGFSTSDNTLSFEYNFAPKKNMILAINVAGGAKDGVFNVVSDSKINTGVSGKLKLHYFLPNPEIAINDSERKAIIRKDNEIKFKYIADTLKFRTSLSPFTKDSISKKKLLDSLKSRSEFLIKGKGEAYLDKTKGLKNVELLKVLKVKLNLVKLKLKNFDSYRDTLLQELRTKRDDPNNTQPFREFNFLSDSLNAVAKKNELGLEKEKILNQIEAIVKEQKANVFSTNLEVENNKKIISAQNEYDLSCKKIAAHRKDRNGIKISKYNTFQADRLKNYKKIDQIRATDIKLNWFSFEGGLTNENYSFATLTETTVLSVEKQNDLIPTLKVSFTHYNNHLTPSKRFSEARNIRYFTISFNFKHGNNIESLSQREIVTNETINATSFYTKSQKAYTGALEKSVSNINLNFDYYQFLGSKDNVGFHLKASAFGGDHYPIYSLRGGLLFAALKKKDMQSIVNFELFFGLNDILKNGRENSLLERNVLGIQTSIPFNFKIK